MLSEEYRQLGKHIAAGAGFVSNLVLWSEGGYFDTSAETKPLLHLWSLGIEEQFYIVWPLLLWAAWKWKVGFLTITILVASISFVLNIEWSKANSATAFYSPQTRFWELLCGSVLAWFALHTSTVGHSTKLPVPTCLSNNGGKLTGDGKTLASALGFIGLFLLGYGFWRIDKDLAFPGWWAVVPVLGAVLIIAAGSNAWVNRTILSHKVAVWFGLISYPLYLWHWPLLSFTRIVEGEAPSRDIRIAAVALSIVLAWFTYKIVERPIQLGKHREGKVAVLFVLMTVIGSVGYTTYALEGLGFRKNATLEGYAGDIGHREHYKYMMNKYFRCTPETIAKEAPEWEGFVRCMQSKSNSEVDIAIVGDSHAEHLFIGMAEALRTKNVAYYIRNRPPFIDNPEFKNIFDTILTSKTIDEVVLAMHWYRGYSEVPAGSTLDKELIKLVDALSSFGKRIYLTDVVPAFPFGAERCKGKRWLATEAPTCEMDLEEFKSQSDAYGEALDKVVQSRPDVKILKIGKYFCDDKRCSMTKGDEILYRDNNHLNIRGSLYLGKWLIEDNPDAFDHVR